MYRYFDIYLCKQIQQNMSMSIAAHCEGVFEYYSSFSLFSSVFFSDFICSFNSSTKKRQKHTRIQHTVKLAIQKDIKRVHSLLFQNQITSNARNDWIMVSQNRGVEFVFRLLEDLNKRFVAK